MADFWIHYVGKGLYSIERFEAEVKRYGVQRAIPFHMIKNFHWGDTVLLAHWTYDKGENYGYAEVFGYFTVDSIVQNLPEEIKEKLVEKLEVVSVESENPKYENRVCGGYFLGAKIYVKDSIESLVDKVKRTCEECGVDPNSFKWFLRGRYTPMKSFILSPAKFTRSYMKISIEDLNLPLTETDGSLVWIYDYKQRTYLRKKDIRALGSETLDNYL